ncbi:MAG: type II toxin-antitoxin system prevent-host-death family antitoxin [Bifidobacteriaceae bacterium]|jgi:prevent-host-death family protein|nr:type II toxin-antitoxin system prevent-host-death family antitoxin [Bifidobacteriaceae bacterium]
MTIQVNVQEAKTTLSRLLAEVENGAEVVVARAGKPVARLTPIEAPARRALGFLGHADIPLEVFAPMTEDEAREWEGT